LDESDNLKDGVFSSRFNTQRETASLINDINLKGGHLLTLGIDYQQDSVDSSTNYTITSRDNTGLFAQYKGQYGDHDLQLSLRQDDNQQFGVHNTGSAAWGYGISDSIRVVASYGTAFAAPTFNDLYFPDLGFGGGNPNLLPEESESLELALNGEAQWGTWSLNLYQTEIDNMIPIWPPSNVNRALIRGFEGSLTTELAGWRMNASLTLQDPRDKSGGVNDGNILLRRSKQKVTLDLGRSFGPYSVGAALVVEGERYDDAANTIKIAGYERVDLRAAYQINKAWQIQGKVENLFDEHYETSNHYLQPGRSAFITVRYQP
jgi:vitamin B12 transporter